MRLAEWGWLEARWVEPERAGRPARHTYRLTGEGGREAARLVARQHAAAARVHQQPIRPDEFRSS
jgi:DNA-binding PadR family transcriptional regulator